MLWRPGRKVRGGLIRSCRGTFAPLLARSRAMARPSPREEPVTMATLPVSVWAGRDEEEAIVIGEVASNLWIQFDGTNDDNWTRERLLRKRRWTIVW